MNTIGELNNLLSEFKMKKNMLDNHTGEIVSGMREWCVKEYERITTERDNINRFVKDNRNILFGKLHSDGYGVHRSESGNFYAYKGFDLAISLNIDNGDTFVSLDRDYEYHNNVGFSWSKLPQPNGRVMREDENGRNQLNLDGNHLSLDYWTDVKRWLAIYNEQLCHISKRLKDLVATLVLEQNNRFDEMKRNCEDITKNDVYEVKISIRKGV